MDDNGFDFVGFAAAAEQSQVGELRAEVERLTAELAKAQADAGRLRDGIDLAMDCMRDVPLTPAGQAGFKVLCKAIGSGWREV